MGGNTITNQVAITLIDDKFNGLFKINRKSECFSWSLTDTKVTLSQNLNSLGKANHVEKSPDVHILLSTMSSSKAKMGHDIKLKGLVRS